MGYRSYFEVTVKYPNQYAEMAEGVGLNFAEFFEKKFEEMVQYSFETNHQPGVLYFRNPDEIKWYDFVEHLTKLSEIFTGCLIECSVNGEEDTDFQEHVFKDGLHASSSASMVFWQTDKEKEEKQSVLDSDVGPRPKSFFS